MAHVTESERDAHVLSHELPIYIARTIPEYETTDAECVKDDHYGPCKRDASKGANAKADGSRCGKPSQTRCNVIPDW